MFTEGIQDVSLQHATFEALYQMGINFEEFKKDKTKRLVLECRHLQEEMDKVQISSKYNTLVL